MWHNFTLFVTISGYAAGVVGLLQSGMENPRFFQRESSGDFFKRINPDIGRLKSGLFVRNSDST
jgi:hypothetical protein